MTDNANSGKEESRCITFYSFKGGVGRTMAIANVAIGRLGDAFRRAGDIVEARLAYQKALSMGRVDAQSRGLAEGFLRLSDLEAESGNLTEAFGLLDAALREAKAIKQDDFQLRIQQKLLALKSKGA
jgi:tetratricopeptide (TPR) repeat protein